MSVPDMVFLPLSLARMTREQGWPHRVYRRGEEPDPDGRVPYTPTIALIIDSKASSVWSSMEAMKDGSNPPDGVEVNAGYAARLWLHLRGEASDCLWDIMVEAELEWMLLALVADPVPGPSQPD